MTNFTSNANNIGRLDCGCRISTIVSAEYPYGYIRWCPLHAHAAELAAAATDLLAEFVIGDSRSPAAQAAARKVSNSLDRSIPHRARADKAIAGPGKGDPL